MRRLFRPLCVAALSLSLAACVSQTITSNEIPRVDTPSTPVAEHQLLDVGIAIFNPGIDDYEEGEQMYPEVRKAEARYMPFLLSEAMQESGAWGAVRVVPNQEQINDLMVSGKILHSDGEELELHIRAVDSQGQVWLDKDYTGVASRYAYTITKRNDLDPFQAVYNTIANDLLQKQETITPATREQIRLVTELRFARSFSPEAFAGYLGQNDDGEYQILRLPARGDPMLARVASIRERDQMFVDTLQEYYRSFGDQMQAPYEEWRKETYEEAVALQELQAESTRQLIAGGLAVIAGIAAATAGDSSTTRTAGQVAVIGGGFLLKSGLEKRNEAQIHVQALEELGMSLEAEITPSVIELEDRSVTLSGNVEDQYAQWRELLADIYAAEVGAVELPPAGGSPTAAIDPIDQH
ncbi:MAG: hypothetical protein KDI05_01060 [Halieaceae bacterium]|nr:hypothetical protein [Halieaceae bacterium]MCP5205431.1 hypothetical protein [Pseudomonadales bacterium]